MSGPLAHTRDARWPAPVASVARALRDSGRRAAAGNRANPKRLGKPSRFELKASTVVLAVAHRVQRLLAALRSACSLPGNPGFESG